MTMEDRVMTSLARPRLYAVVVASFGLSAVLISGVGLFGVLSFSVAQRTREIGVRTALGAQARDIVALVLGQALWIVGGGIALGLAAALAGAQLLSAFCMGSGPATRSRSSWCQSSLWRWPLSRASCPRAARRR
jgi:ABC-type antimicrobial peptide transport system permease subunit